MFHLYSNLVDFDDINYYFLFLGGVVLALCDYLLLIFDRLWWKSSSLCNTFWWKNQTCHFISRAPHSFKNWCTSYWNLDSAFASRMDRPTNILKVLKDNWRRSRSRFKWWLKEKTQLFRSFSRWVLDGRWSPCRHSWLLNVWKGTVRWTCLNKRSLHPWRLLQLHSYKWWIHSKS